MRFRWSFVLCFLFLAPFEIVAQDIVDDTDTMMYHEVIISKDKNLNFSNAELKKVSLERNNFVHLSGQTFMENIAQVPGVQMVVTGTNVVKPILRGMTLSRVWVGEHYVKQEGQQWGLDHGVELNPFTEGNISIVKGPATVLFGPDAVGGSIHIEHHKNYALDTHKLQVMSMYKSVNDLYGVNAQFQTLHNKNKFKLQASYQSYGDYRVPADQFVYNSFVLPINDKRLINTSGTDANMLMSYLYDTNDWKIFTQASYFHQEAGLFKGAFGRPQSMDLTHDHSYRNIEEPKQLTDHWKYFVDINKALANGDINAVFSIQNNMRQEKSAHRHSGQLSNEALSLNLITAQGQLSYKHFWSAQQVSQLLFTSSWQKNKISGYEFLIPAYEKVNHGLGYIHSIYLNKHKINFGIRIDANNYFTENASRVIIINGTEQSIPAHEKMDILYWALNTHFSWDYKLNSQNIFQAHISKIERTPNIAELASNGIHHGTFRHELGDGRLENETGYMLDFGWVYNTANWDIHVTPFLYYFSNYIFLKPTAFFSTLPEGGQLYQYTQSAAFMAGGEVQWLWQMNDQFDGEVAIEYVYAHNITEAQPLPLTPPLSLKNKISYSLSSEYQLLDNLKLSYLFSFFNAQNRVSKNERITPAFNLHDIVIEKSFSVLDSEFKLDIQLRNVLNTPYFNHLSRYRILNIPEPGRSVAVTLKYRF